MPNDSSKPQTITIWHCTVYLLSTSNLNASAQPNSLRFTPTIEGQLPMVPKRKSDAIELDISAQGSSQQPDNALGRGLPATVLEPPAKKARTKKDAAAPATGQTWKDIKLEGEEEGGVPVYDTCGEVRRKIRLLQKTPGWKVTQWLREIGDINTNSYSRFMKESAKQGGAGNGTYYAAYVYFEKVRVLERKKKTATRLENEATHPGGFSLETSRPAWVLMPRK